MASQNPRKRILVGEDSLESLRLIESFLKSLGLEWKSAADGAALLKIAREDTFDLLLVDIGLPVMSGLDVVRVLRKEGLKCPVVAISANSSAQDLENYRAAGFTDSLAKPFNRKQFTNKVRCILSLDSDAAADSEGPGLSWAPLAAQFAESLPPKMKELYAALEAQDFSQVELLAHRIRAAGMFGFTAVSELCAEIERVLKVEDHAKIPQLLEKLSNAVREIQPGP